MMDWFASHYDALRAAHLVAVMAWMAGLMYLPRLYVYHSRATPGSELDGTLVVMERRLLRGIMHPSLVVVWGLGLALLAARGWADVLAMPWMHLKLTCVVAISGVHGFYTVWQKAFEAGGRPLNHVAFRFINELPFLLMIGAVIAVVLEPFA